MTEALNECGRIAANDAPQIIHGEAQHSERTSSTMQSNLSSSASPKTPTLDVSSTEPLVPAGFELIRLNRRSKAARDTGWTSVSPMTVSEVRKHMAQEGNVGIRLRDEDLVVDVDPRNGGDESFKKLSARFPIPVSPQVVTGGGGLHVYLRKPLGLQLVGKLAEYPGIDFLSAGKQVVAPGSVHPSGIARYEWDVLCGPELLQTIPMAPKGLLEALKRRVVDSENSAGEATPEELARLLRGLDPCDYPGYKDWLDIGMAAHHATAGQGKAEFIEWCARNPEYNDKVGLAEAEAKWESFSLQGGSRKSVTLGTIFHLLNSVGRGDLIESFHRSSAEDDFSDEPDLWPAAGLSDTRLG